eukprot:1157630-Pelagomonas_calceolata.AAC.1
MADGDEMEMQADGWWSEHSGGSARKMAEVQARRMAGFTVQTCHHSYRHVIIRTDMSSFVCLSSAESFYV